MTISSIGSNANWWQLQQQAAQNQTGSSATTGGASGSGSVSNNGTSAPGSNINAFLQTFASDLQTLLTQSGTAINSATASQVAAPSSTATDATNQTASAQPMSGMHHHHHHSGGGDSEQGGSVQTAANNIVGSIGQIMQNGSLMAGGTATAANTLAGDMMQALSAYTAGGQASSAMITTV